MTNRVTKDSYQNQDKVKGITGRIGVLLLLLYSFLISYQNNYGRTGALELIIGGGGPQTYG